MCTDTYAHPRRRFVDLKVCDIEMQSKISVIPKAKGDKQEAVTDTKLCTGILQSNSAKCEKKKHRIVTALVLYIQHVVNTKKGGQYPAHSISIINLDLKVTSLAVFISSQAEICAQSDCVSEEFLRS